MTELTTQETQIQQLFSEQMSAMPAPNIMRLANIERELMLAIDKSKTRNRINVNWLYLLLGGSMAVAATMGGYDYFVSLFEDKEEVIYPAETLFEDDRNEKIEMTEHKKQQSVEKIIEKNVMVDKESPIIYRKEVY